MGNTNKKIEGIPFTFFKELLNAKNQYEKKWVNLCRNWFEPESNVMFKRQQVSWSYENVFSDDSHSHVIISLETFYINIIKYIDKNVICVIGRLFEPVNLQLLKLT